MTTPPRQLALELPFRPAFGLEDFLVSKSNEAAVALIDRWPDWPAGAAVLSGPAGSGKTHLANVWRAKSGAGSIAATDLTADKVPVATAGRALVIENIDGGQVDERALFHVLNLVRESKFYVLMTSVARPGDIPIALPDFSSRLKALPLAEIAAPDDALLGAVLVKQFADRQVAVDPTVISYCLVRMERSMDAARRIVAELDSLALSKKRGVTRTLAAEALANLFGAEKSG